MAQVDILHGSDTTQLQYSSGADAGEGEVITVTFDHRSYPVLIESNLHVEEGDDDWEWEERDRWNATVDGMESMLLTALTHLPYRCREAPTKVFVQRVCTDMLQHLSNNF